MQTFPTNHLHTFNRDLETFEGE